ncbi:MAG TPA: protein kinase [Pyrinomonadaceae bacterium]|jgi:serine/threonine-protein kinase|nr:protein kinase [Pyrinomonadaceae bacterium]
MIGSNLLNYRILEKLGAGGQGTVYKALDERLNRIVVIKVLAPELTAREVNLKRFEREAQLASSLDHPNICTIYALHELEGLHFIVMQYVEGKNVRELVNGQPLELASALSITYQVADALTAAHARGIIHRDIKAGNVMVTETGLVKVLDFGLAKLLDESTGQEGNIHLTELGVPYGTATYAAPEQATGQKVDHRADIFSTGVLLYETLSGTWPFRGKTSIEVRYAVLHDQPQSVAQVRSDNPPPRLQQILNRALEKRPEARYQRMEEMRDDLREVRRELGAGGPGTTEIHASVAPVVPRHQSETGGFGRTFRRWLRSLTGSETQPTSIPPASTSSQERARQTAPLHQPPPTPPREIHDTAHSTHTSTQTKSIAILPFRNLSHDPEVSFYEFSLADAVITELARLRSLVVRPSSLIVKYQGKEVDPREVGRELSVTAVLAASFLRVGERLRVTAQLFDVESGEILWSDRIDTATDDLMAVQDLIAQRIVDGLSVEQRPDEEVGLSSHSTRNAAAYEEYLRGRDCHGKFIYHTLAPEDSDEAIRHFERAVEVDPRFALAHCALGGAYANRVIKGFGGAEDYRRAEEEFNLALELDPRLLEARLHMVFIYLSRGEKQKARAWVEILRHEAPNDVGVHFVNGTLARLDGNYDEALKSFQRMLRLNPAERVVVSYNRARIFMYQSRYDDALAELDLGAAMEPHHPLIKTFRAVVFYRRGQLDEAIAVLREVLARHPRMDGIRPIYAICLSRKGEHAAARAELTGPVCEAAAADHDIAYWLASAYALEGERDEAFKWLERAITLGNENSPWFEADSNWEALRDDPRFKDLMRRIAISRHSNSKDVKVT